MGKIVSVGIKNDVEKADHAVQDAMDVRAETHQNIAIVKLTKRSKVGFAMRVLRLGGDVILRKTIGDASDKVVGRNGTVDKPIDVLMYRMLPIQNHA
jgi:hypothetical protein